MYPTENDVIISAQSIVRYRRPTSSITAMTLTTARQSFLYFRSKHYRFPLNFRAFYIARYANGAMLCFLLVSFYFFPPHFFLGASTDILKTSYDVPLVE